MKSPTLENSLPDKLNRFIIIHDDTISSTLLRSLRLLGRICLIRSASKPNSVLPKQQLLRISSCNLDKLSFPSTIKKYPYWIYCQPSPHQYNTHFNHFFLDSLITHSFSPRKTFFHIWRPLWIHYFFSAVLWPLVDVVNWSDTYSGA